MGGRIPGKCGFFAAKWDAKNAITISREPNVFQREKNGASKFGKKGKESWRLPFLGREKRDKGKKGASFSSSFRRL